MAGRSLRWRRLRRVTTGSTTVMPDMRLRVSVMRRAATGAHEPFSMSPTVRFESFLRSMWCRNSAMAGNRAPSYVTEHRAMWLRRNASATA